jgi:hypothetical protein
MNNQKNSVFFSCVVDGVYIEFKINDDEEVIMPIKREQFYNYKYASICTEEERKFTFKKLIVLKDMLRNRYLDIHAFMQDEDLAFKEWLKQLLTKSKMIATFSINVEDVPHYFQAMREYAIKNNMLDEYEEQILLYTKGLKNTAALTEENINIKNGSFITTIDYSEKPVILEKRCNQKIS